MKPVAKAKLTNQGTTVGDGPWANGLSQGNASSTTAVGENGVRNSIALFV